MPSFPPKHRLPSLPGAAFCSRSRHRQAELTQRFSRVGLTPKSCGRRQAELTRCSGRVGLTPRSHDSSARAARTRSPPRQDSPEARPSRRPGLAQRLPIPASRSRSSPRPALAPRLGVPNSLDTSLERSRRQESPRPVLALAARTCPTLTPTAEPNAGLPDVSTHSIRIVLFIHCIP
jgi:hypothetical protein